MKIRSNSKQIMSELSRLSMQIVCIILDCHVEEKVLIKRVLQNNKLRHVYEFYKTQKEVEDVNEEEEEEVEDMDVEDKKLTEKYDPPYPQQSLG